MATLKIDGPTVGPPGDEPPGLDPPPEAGLAPASGSSSGPGAPPEGAYEAADETPAAVSVNLPVAGGGPARLPSQVPPEGAPLGADDDRAPLEPVRLFWRALCAWLARLFGRLFSR